MGYTYYKLMALIPKDSVITLDDIYLRLQRKFSKIEAAHIERPDPNHIQLRFNDWLYYIYLEDEPHIVVESGEMQQPLLISELTGI